MGADGEGERGVAEDRSQREGGDDYDANFTKVNKDERNITLIFLGANCKYMSEMENNNTKLGIWPSDLIMVKLIPYREGRGGLSFAQNNSIRIYFSRLFQT